jgi:hypothetical protein
MNKMKIGDGVVQPEFVEAMKAIAMGIDAMFNEPDDKEVGFILMIFPFGDDGARCNYMSNAYRDDVLKMLKEQIRYFEADKRREMQ